MIKYKMHSSIYLVPYWIASQMRSLNLPVSQVLDYEKTKQHLTKNDIQTLFASKDALEKVLFPRLNRQLFNNWNFNCSCGDDIITDTDLKIADSPEFKQGIIERISTPRTSMVDVCVSRNDPAPGFELIPVRDEALLCVIYNTQALRNDRVEFQYQVLRSIVKQLYVFETAQEVAVSNVYLAYLETLLLRTSVPA